MKFAAVASGVLVTALVASCRSATADLPDWAVRMAAEDPAFGGGVFFGSRLLGSPLHEVLGDPEARTLFLHEQRSVHDQHARRLAREILSLATAEAALTFLESDAGAALAAAESLTLTLYAWHDDSFFRQAAGYFGDPAKVGAAAVTQRESVRAAMAAGGSASPPGISMILGAATLSPEQAAAVAAFYRSAPGADWLEARCKAFGRTQERYRAMRSEAERRGLIRSKLDLPDLILPRPNSRLPTTTTRAR